VLTRVWLGGASVALGKLAALGQGGEADVYDLGDGRALKVWKTPDHPDVAGVAELERAAEHRLAEAADKLRAFPAGMPPRVVAPAEVATTTRRGHDVAGYAMAKVEGAPLVHWAEPHYRRAHPVAADAVVAMLRDLHLTVDAVHRAGAVIGDFNDGNVLVSGAGAARLIDADSWQFGRWRATMFSERFVDPRLCAPGAAAPVLARPHDADGDWYAFTVMVFRSLLLTGPYGGVFAPRDPARRVAQAARPLHRISVFDPEVRYPKAAVPWQVLPDDLIDHLRAVFVDGRRGRFPAALLDRLRFTRCGCGAEHARAGCPSCRTSVPVPAAVVVRGRVRATRIDPASFTAPAPAVWIDGGTLWRHAAFGPEPIGQVLAGHTRVWAGDAIGVGLYRAGGYTNAFVFRPDRRGLRDGVAIPRIRGGLVDVHGVCGADRAWLWWREALAGKETVRCAAISAAGDVLGVADAPADDAGWLDAVRGACAVGPLLLVPTDAGVVRIEAAAGALTVTRTFPDTADFVTSADRLRPAPGGLDVQTRDGALRLTLS
jgi:hypothetical protein